ncbi:MAG: hypothetical protein MRQ11_02200 [Candidatus Midichloria mitochondrii]|nr:hypothetical protein [Candidatus Midichloria mitochondrii]MDJ1583500.1 hypothetical protein [Candidatus Midichloria mitochondrii]
MMIIKDIVVTDSGGEYSVSVLGRWIWGSFDSKVDSVLVLTPEVLQ